VKKIISFIIFGFIFLIINSYQVYAIRPLSTEDATVVEKGAFEAEIGFEYIRQDNRDNNYTILLVPNYGLTERIQLCCELPFDILRPDGGPDEEGLGDISLASKILIFQETEKIPSLVFKPVVKLATGDEDKGLGSGDEDISFILTATKSIGQATFHSNVGYTFVGKEKDDSLKDCLLYGVALEYPIYSKLTIVTEVYGESKSDFDNEAYTINPLIGLTYQLTDKITFDAAFKMGARRNTKTEYGIISGVSISF